ncbi:SAM-dependent methyltransferase [Liquorilactobacillus capillatus]|nr:SAM-dependent methyltransferase [Liquorilactobacillus capillatus]
MDKNKLKSWYQEEKYGIKGWDFSHLDDRWKNETLPWNYQKIVLRYLTTDMQLLDMGTGDGELLKTFHHSNNRTQVTEAWAPNIDLLKRTIVRQGIKLHALLKTHEADLPVKNNSLDIIINSHAAFDPKLIKDKLKTGGYFISQQVGALNNYSLARFFDGSYIPAYPDNTLLNTSIKFQNLNFEILVAKEYQADMAFFDVGAIVYYASIIPWEFPNFSVDHCLKQLNQLDQAIKTFGSVVTKEDRFILVARKK